MTTPPLTAQAYYTLAEAARFARVGQTTIRDAYRANALRVFYRTTRPLIKHEDLVAWIESAPTREDRPTRRGAA